MTHAEEAIEERDQWVHAAHDLDTMLATAEAEVSELKRQVADQAIEIADLEKLNAEAMQHVDEAAGTADAIARAKASAITARESLDDFINSIP